MGFEVRFLLNEFSQSEAMHALDKQTNRSIGSPEKPVYCGNGTNPVKVFRSGGFQLRVDRSHQADQLIAADHIIHQLNGSGLSNR